LKSKYLFQLTEKGREKVRLNRFYGQANPGYTGIYEAVLRCLDREGPLIRRQIAEKLNKYAAYKVNHAVYNLIRDGFIDKLLYLYNNDKYNVQFSPSVSPPPTEAVG